MTQVLGICVALLRFAMPLPWQERQVSIPGISESAAAVDVFAS